MLALLVALALSAEPSGSVPKTLAVPGFSYANLDAKSADVFVDYFTQQLALKAKVRVTSRAEVVAILGNERQRQLLTCQEDTECFTELSNALGTEGLITGSLAKLGSSFVVNVKIIWTRSAAPVAIYSKRVPSEDALLAFLDESAADFARLAAGAEGKSGAVAAGVVEAPAAGSPSGSWRAPLIGGAVLAAVSAGSFVFAAGVHDRLVRGDPSVVDETQLRALAGQGSLAQTVGLGAGALAAIGLAAGVGFLVWSGPSAPAAAPSVSFVPISGGGWFVVQGVLP